jgi:hypothetical protein
VFSVLKLWQLIWTQWLKSKASFLKTQAPARCLNPTFSRPRRSLQVQNWLQPLLLTMERSPKTSQRSLQLTALRSQKTQGGLKPKTK